MKGNFGRVRPPSAILAERINYAELRDFVVYIDGPAAERPSRGVITTTSQKRPRAKPILAGTIIEWPNQDAIYHKVFSISEAKHFDLELYKSSEIKRAAGDLKVDFTPGIINLPKY